jgi:DNA (cytosine-5)-methyltransferase 1
MIEPKQWGLNGLDLFSGIGGISIALSKWVRTVAYCESDKYAQGVLLSRMQSCELDRAPIWDDVRTLKGSMLPKIDIIFGGFPCQDISVAGNGAGLAGERSGLYSEIERLIEETSPAFVFLENVPAIRTRGLGRVVWGLSSIGYDCRWAVVSAQSVGAPHKRNRWFLLASNAKSRNDWLNLSKPSKRQVQQSGVSIESATLANSFKSRLEGNHGEKQKDPSFTQFDRDGWWETEPSVGRVVHGLQFRVDRIKSLGNSVVPKQAQAAFVRLMGLDADKI